jgi:hypothetical protein
MQTESSWEQGIGLVAGVHAGTWLDKLRSSGRDVARDLSTELAIAGFIAARDAYADAG